MGRKLVSMEANEYFFPSQKKCLFFERELKQISFVHGEVLTVLINRIFPSLHQLISDSLLHCTSRVLGMAGFGWRLGSKVQRGWSGLRGFSSVAIPSYLEVPKLPICCVPLCASKLQNAYFLCVGALPTSSISAPLICHQLMVLSRMLGSLDSGIWGPIWQGT
jgi:hypothetical protein